jgi:hypothetical protein
MSKRKLKYLILLNLIWSILSIYTDWTWLTSIPPHLILFTSICSLYPPLLTIWYLIKYYGGKPPNWLTLWILVGITSYGILAQIYFPLLMSWKGINFHDAGSMFWVAVYAFQALILYRFLKPPQLPEVLWVIAFLSAADYSHYFLKTFVDLTLPGYPVWLGTTIALLGVTIQIGAVTFYIFLSRHLSKKSS